MPSDGLLRRSRRSDSEPRLVVASVDGLSGRRTSDRTESVVPGALVDSVDEFVDDRPDPIREENGRARELSGVASTVDRVEVSVGAGVMVLDRLVAGDELSGDRLGCDGTSRRAPMRSARERRTVELRSDTSGAGLRVIGLADVPAPIRLPISLRASGPELLFCDGCKDLLLNELRFCGVIRVPSERSFTDGV